MKSRPTSATSASSGFGNFKKSSNLQINPKISQYHSNGTGRDGYINFSNGGFRKTWENNYNNVLTLKTSRGDNSKPVRIDSKVVIYKSNGCGRDSYIATSCGGFFKNNSNFHHTQFSNTLRNYDSKPVIKKYDFLHLSQTFVRKDLRPTIMTLCQKQRAQSARLSTPKGFKSVKTFV